MIHPSILAAQLVLIVVLAGVSASCGFAAVPVWPIGREGEMNGFYSFRASVVSDVAAKGVLKATAGYSYRARVNGGFVGYGPARSAPGFFRVDEWPVELSAGTNTVELEVAGYNCNNFYLPDQAPFIQAEVSVGDRVLAQTAKCGDFVAREAGRVRKVPRFCYQRGFAEIYRLPEAHTEALPLAEQSAKTLLPREWAYPDFSVTEPFAAVSTERVVRDESVKPHTDRCLVQCHPGYKIFPLEELAENPHYDLQKLKTISRQKGAAAKEGWYALSRETGVVFETTREFAGFPRFRARCREPVTLYFTFDEFVQPDGSVDNFRAETLGAVIWHLAPGEYDLEGFEPVACKAARILAVGGEAEVTAPSVRTYVSPSADCATFRASDPAFEKIFNAAKASYAANAVDCLTDCPIRERAGWLGDSFFTGRASQWLTGSGKNERLFFDNFLRPERFDCEPEFTGLVPAVWPVDLMTKDCFIPNYDLWLVQELEDHVRRTGDKVVAEAFRARVLGLIAALDTRLNSDGLLENLPGWVFVEWSRANSLVQDVNYPSNMMYAETLDAAARLYGLPAFAGRAAKMRETIRRQSLTADGWYSDNAVRQKDGSLRLSGERTEVCQYYAFFTGVATKERDAKLWNRLVKDFGPERIKNAKWDCGDNLWLRLSTPIRKGVWKEIWPANMIFGTCLRMELLSREGRSAQIAREMKEHFLPMAEKTGTLWEHGDPRASCCHGFAAIAAEYLYRDILGVLKIDDATKTIRVSPVADLPLDWCEGNVPLPDGEIAVVKWQKRNGQPSLSLTLPSGWKHEASLPGGWSLEMLGKPGQENARFARPIRSLMR